MFNKNFRILIFDNNSSIHQDIIQILANQDDHTVSPELSYLDLHSRLKPQPQFFIDRAFHADDGINKIKLALQQNYPYSLVFIDIKYLSDAILETNQKIWALDRHIQIIICLAFTG